MIMIMNQNVAGRKSRKGQKSQNERRFRHKFLFSREKIGELFGAFPSLAFIIPLIVRAIPEILMVPYIVGFDTMSYISLLLTWQRRGVEFWNLFASAPLFCVILLGFMHIGVPITFMLKLLPPILHGLLGLSIYFYASRALAWSDRKSLFASLVAALYFVALRISWDLLRNELGLIFLFITLTFLAEDGDRLKHNMLLLLLASLVVLVHQLVAVMMLFIILGMAINNFFKNRNEEVRKLVVVFTIPTLLFFLFLYANLKYGVLGPSFAPMDPLLFEFSSYQDIVVNTVGFLVYSYLPMLPLAIMGIKYLKNLQIKLWLLLCLSSVVLPVIFPSSFLWWGYRWTLMLVYPFSFYVMEALMRLKLNVFRWIFASILTILTLGFILMPSNCAFPYYVLFPNYIPSSMLQNTVPLRDCRDVTNSLVWFKNNIGGDGRLLVHEAFYGWAFTVLNEDQIIPYSYDYPEKIAQKMFQDGYNQLYLIWWINGSGWHGRPTVPYPFDEIYRSGEIAIYAYKQS